MPEEPPKLERRQGDFHELAWAEWGVCNMCGGSNAEHGCKTCGLRLCGGKAGYACMNKHFAGFKPLHPPRKEVVFLEYEDCND